MEFFSRWRLHEQHRQLPLVGHDHHLDLQVVQCIHLVIYSASGGTGDSKGKRKQNVVSVQISEAAPEEGFSVEGAEVGMVVVVGRVVTMEKAATKSTYTIQDDSGELEVIQWLEEGTNQPEFREGSPVKVIGSIRYDNIFTSNLTRLYVPQEPGGEEAHHGLQDLTRPLPGGVRC